MSDDRFTRRDFLTNGTAITLGTVGSLAGSAANASAESLDSYSRFHPSFGGPVGSPHYLGKLVPGLRKSGLAPVPIDAPDLKKLEYKIVRGAKEFHLRAMAVKQEFLPGRFMNVWGFNGSMPGPIIEATQGDRVRIIVHNDLPEATSMHWHGLEIPVAMDGVPYLVQDPIQPGKSFVYEFDLHQTGTFFYHAHVPMQEAMGMTGFFIIHPKIAYDPPVDHDFALIYQNFMIPPNADIPDTTLMDWNWHTINGRSGPFATPMVAKHGSRVRVRLMNFSPMQHHPIHFHGHTFWLTGTEAGRIPESAWIPRNNTLVGVAMVQDFEFIANNPGDWIFHCHMVHHMMNHMVRQSGPRVRNVSNMAGYADIDNLPDPKDVLQGKLQDASFKTPGYPEAMQGMMMSEDMSREAMSKITAARQTHGMRRHWYEGVKGLMTVLRVLPEPYYNQVMHTNNYIAPGSIFDAIAQGKYSTVT